jgi:uncharacterized alkaline shock family protein YloU
MPYKIANANSGDTIYGRKVINSIITLAAQEISGVSGLHGKGFRADFNGMTVDVDIYLNVYTGVSCADVAYRIQENIKRSVESMTAFKVNVINVNILGVSFKERTDGV